MYGENNICAATPPSESVEVLLSELAGRIYRSNSLASQIKTVLTGPTPVAEQKESVPSGIVGYLELLIRFVSDTNDVLYDASTILSSNNG